MSIAGYSAALTRDNYQKKSMRRKDKEITDIKSMEEIIAKAEVCRLALCFDNLPYVVPVCFGYKDKTIYFHSAKKGRKIEILIKNNRVCFEFDIDHELIESENGCSWGMKFKSVIGSGKVYFIEKADEKQAGLDIIMQQYSDKIFKFPEKQLNNTLVAKIDIEHMTGKKSGC